MPCRGNLFIFILTWVQPLGEHRSNLRIVQFGVHLKLAHEAAPARKFPDVSQAGAHMKNDAIERESPLQPMGSHGARWLVVDRECDLRWALQGKQTLSDQRPSCFEVGNKLLVKE